MPANPPENMPRVTPYLYYEDVVSALDWLARAFGFRERMRMPGADGRITHAEMELADGVIMMGHPGPDYRNPRRLGHVTQTLYVYVDDVDQHFKQAKEAGAKIIEEPQDQFYGDRRYGAEDPEGHHWYFAQHVRDVAPEDMKRSAYNHLPLTAVRERELEAQAAAQLGIAPAELQSRLRELGRSIGPPWRLDEKRAALVAWLALQGAGENRVGRVAGTPR